MGINRVIVYCRISVKKQKSLLSQEQRCRTYANRHGFIVACVIQDIGPRWKRSWLPGSKRAQLLSLKLKCPILVDTWDRLGAEDNSEEFLHLSSTIGVFHSVAHDTLNSAKLEGLSGMPDKRAIQYFQQYMLQYQQRKLG